MRKSKRVQQRHIIHIYSETIFSKKLFSVDLSGQGDVCELPSYPASRGPVTMTFDSGDLVACGEWENVDYKECYRFDGVTWQPLPPLQEVHWPYAYYTRSFLMEGGLWVGGDDASDVSDRKGMVNELFTAEGQWITLPIGSPYENIDWPDPCYVPINNTHVFFSGGYSNGFQVDTWILDLVNFVWTPSTPMLIPRGGHSCMVVDGEVLVVGGGGSGPLEFSLHTFNPVSLEWRVSGSLPSEMNTNAPGLFLRNGKLILVEMLTDNIWEMEEDEGWRLMDAKMGASFNGRYANAALVPEIWREGCP